jgi:hypothetical protein
VECCSTSLQWLCEGSGYWWGTGTKPDVEFLGWQVYMWSAVVRPVRRTTKFSKTMSEGAYGREINIKLSGNSSGGHSCSQHANCMLHFWDTLIQVMKHETWDQHPLTYIFG